MNWANYLIQINLYLTLFYAFYILFLSKETFFNLNRVYLLSAAIFSVFIPLIRTEWMKSLFFTAKVQQNWSSVNVMVMEGFATPLKQESAWALGDYLTFVYLFVMLFLVLRLIFRLIKVQKMLNSDNHPEAFSFFRKVRVNQDLPQKEQIEKHEQTHAKQLHTADVLFFEILSIINWFNPVTYLYKKSIRQIHEFIADEQALHLQNNKKDYALLLFSKSFGINPNSLTNNFFNQSLLKRRIMMLQKPKSRKTAILKYGLSTPLFLIAMVLSSATINENKTIKQIENQIQPAQTLAEIMLPKVVENLVIENKEEEVVFDKPVISSVITGEFDALKKHVSRTIKYPAEAKQKEMMARFGVEFKVNKQGIIESAKSLNQTENDFSNEAIKSVTSFQEKINVAEGNYTYFFVFKLDGSNKMIIDETSNLGIIKNFIGEITLTAYLANRTALNEVVVVGYGTKTNEEPVFTNVEVLPGFTGGLDAFGKFLAANLRYPAIARENNIQGRVFLSFVVEKDGGLSNIKVARGIGGGCDEEAVRVLSISPKWKPGVQNGNIVRVSYTVPIFFQMNNKAYSTSDQNKINLSLVELVKNKQVLLIIDGEEISSDSKELNDILKPEDIESMNVLKDEAAIKLYGDKGKNGVIQIITKKKK
jgi:TonB family protein